MKSPFVIGITGGSGSGKTSLIRRIRQEFPDDQVCILSQDDYYRPRTEQELDAQGIRNFDLPHSIEQEAFVQDVEKLIRMEPVSRMEYTFNNEKANPRQLWFHPAPVLILEGIFVFYDAGLQPLVDLKVFVHARENLKIIRRIRRDQTERNYPLEDVLYRYQHHVSPAYEAYIRPFHEEADLVINNNESFEPGLAVLLSYIRQKAVERNQD